MAREHGLPAATRNYVIFGLAFVIATVLAARAWFAPATGRGAPDGWLRVLVVSDDVIDLAEPLNEHGLSALQRSPVGVVSDGRSLVDPDTGPLETALAYADEHGYGFMAVARSDFEGQFPGALDAYVEVDVEADAEHEESLFVVFSVGDRAQGTIHAQPGRTAAAPLYERPIQELDSIRLALFTHPDFLALWDAGAEATAQQARGVFDNRDVLELTEILDAAHRSWIALSRSWVDAPSSESERPLSPPWTQSSAWPVVGGVLVARAPAHILVDAAPVTDTRRSRLEIGHTRSLEFIPSAALSRPQPAARSGDSPSCAGLPKTFEGQLVVSDDGRSLLFDGDHEHEHEHEHEHKGGGEAELWRFTHAPGQPCAAELRATMANPSPAPLVSLSTEGKLLWAEGETLLWADLLDAPRLPDRLSLPGVDRFAPPRWLDGATVVSLSHQPPEPDLPSLLPRDHALTFIGIEPDSFEVQLPLAALSPDVAPTAELARGLEVIPVGADTLLLLTEGCSSAPAEGPPCMLRIRAVDGRSLASLAREAAALPPETPPATWLREQLRVDFIGPVGPYSDIAFAFDGSALAWVDDAGARVLRLPREGAADLPVGPPLPLRQTGGLRAPRLTHDGAFLLVEHTIELPPRLGSGGGKAPTLRAASALSVSP